MPSLWRGHTCQIACEGVQAERGPYESEHNPAPNQYKHCGVSDLICPEQSTALTSPELTSPLKGAHVVPPIREELALLPLLRIAVLGRALRREHVADSILAAPLRWIHSHPIGQYLVHVGCTARCTSQHGVQNAVSKSRAMYSEPESRVKL